MPKAEILRALDELKTKLTSSRNLDRDIREGFAHLRKAIDEEIDNDYLYIDEELLAGLELLIEDTPDMELRPTLRAMVRKLHAKEEPKGNRFITDESPIETARRLRCLV